MIDQRKALNKTGANQMVSRVVDNIRTREKVMISNVGMNVIRSQNCCWDEKTMSSKTMHQLR